MKGVLVEEVVNGSGSEAEFYQRFDFTSVTTKEDVWVFLSNAFVYNLYDEDDVLAGKNLLIGVPRCAVFNRQR